MNELSEGEKVDIEKVEESKKEEDKNEENEDEDTNLIIVKKAIEEEKEKGEKQLLKQFQHHNNENNENNKNNENKNENQDSKNEEDNLKKHFYFDRFNNEEIKEDEEKEDEKDIQMVNKIMVKDSNNIEKRKFDKFPDDSNIKLFKENLNDLINQLNNQNYFENIPQKVKNIFNINIINDNALLKGFQPKIIISYNQDDNKLINGLCQISYENEDDKINIKINHLSSINNWIEQIDNLIQFIINYFSFNQMFITLNYSNEEENIDNEVKELFEDKLKFKSNEKNEDNTQTFYLIKQKNDINNEQLINIDTLNIVSFDTLKLNQENNNDKFINIFSIYALLAEKKFNNDIILEEKNQNAILLDRERLREDLENIINYYLNIENKTSIKDIIKDKVNYDLDSILYKKDKCDLITMKINPQFENIISIRYNNYIYNRIESEIKIMKEPKTNSNFYFISTKDNNICMIICELNSELKKQFIYKNQNIYEYFYSFYNKMILESENKNVIYIPSFNLEGNVFCNSLNTIEKNVYISNNSYSMMYFNTVDELFKVKMNYDINIQHNCITFPKLDNEELVINDNFLFGICNNNVLNNSNVPAIQLFIVTKDYWLKNEKDI